jgi:CheY-like chemotaxis protein
MVLQEEGHEVEGAQDGIEGLEKGKSFRPNLVITDLLLDQLSGFEVSLRIATGEAGFSAPVIFYTGFYRDTEARKEMSVKYGAVDYLMKPYQLEALKKRAADLMNPEVRTDEILGQRDGEDATNAAVRTESRTGERPNAQALDLTPLKFEEHSRREPERSVPAPKRMPLAGDEPKSWVGSRAPNISLRPTPGFPKNSRAEARGMREPGFSRRDLGPLSPERFPRDRGHEPPGSNSHDFRSGQKRPQGPSLTRFKSFLLVGFLMLLILGLFLLRNHIFLLYKNVEMLTFRTEKSPELNQANPQTPSSPASDGTADNRQGAIDEKSPPASPSSLPGPTVEDSPRGPAAKDSSKLTTERPAAKTKTEASPGLGSAPSIGVSISDVTGASGPPFLQKSKQPLFSPELIPLAGGKPLVVRIMVDREGKILEATPLNLNPSNAALSEVALSAIQSWQFSRVRGGKSDTAARYFSFKVTRR